jgi:hypothetical protein
MSESVPAKFNPRGEVTFDLACGQVHLDGAPARVMVPADALQVLCEAAGRSSIAELGRVMGEAIGRRIRVRLGAVAADLDGKQHAVREAPFEQVIEQLAMELALVGLGALSAERWGRALVLVVAGSPLGSMSGAALLADILAAALEAAIGIEAAVQHVDRDGTKSRFAVVSAASAAAIQNGLAAGTGFAEILGALQRGATQ